MGESKKPAPKSPTNAGDLASKITEQEFRPGVKTYTCPRCTYSSTNRADTVNHLHHRHMGDSSVVVLSQQKEGGD